MKSAILVLGSTCAFLCGLLFVTHGLSRLRENWFAGLGTIFLAAPVLFSLVIVFQQVRGQIEQADFEAKPKKSKRASVESLHSLSELAQPLMPALLRASSILAMFAGVMFLKFSADYFWPSDGEIATSLIALSGVPVWFSLAIVFNHMRQQNSKEENPATKG